MFNTTLCYIEQDGKYLMLYRNKKKNDINEGKWIGIGGKFEKNETPEQCLLREVYEETGLKLTSYRYRGLIHFIFVINLSSNNRSDDSGNPVVINRVPDQFIPCGILRINGRNI